MSDIIVQNNDAREYVGYYRAKTPGNGKIESAVVRKVTLPANDIIRIDETVWNVVLGVNGGRNTIAEKLAQGRITVVNGGAGLSEENRGANAAKDSQYQNFLSMFKMIRDRGGKDNRQFDTALTRDGLPNLDMTRLNMGKDVTGDDYELFSRRLRLELRSGMHSKSLVIPGAEEFERALGRPAEPKEGQNSEAKAPTYDEQVEKLHECIGYLRDEGGFGKDGKPRVGSLRERGFAINTEQRDVLWVKYLEKYPVTDESAE